MDDLIYNWMLLYKAIMISDYDNGKDFVICLYDSENKNVLVGVFNNDNRVARLFNMSSISITQERSNNALIANRYFTKRINCGTTSTPLEYYQIVDAEINNREMEFIERLMS